MRIIRGFNGWGEWWRLEGRGHVRHNLWKLIALLLFALCNMAFCVRRLVHSDPETAMLYMLTALISVWAGYKLVEYGD